jgi:hypothetical protein
MRPHIWRKRSGFTVGGYMWIVLNQADILEDIQGGTRKRRDIYRARGFVPQLFFEFLFFRGSNASG